jgi:hypothetical protein
MSAVLRASPLLAACVVGGGPPGGVDAPCRTIHMDCVEAWEINEASGGTAAGFKGNADLALAGWDTSPVNDWWNQAGSTDGGRQFFGGTGTADISSVLPDGFMANVGDSVTIAQRRWYVGTNHTKNVVPYLAMPFGDALYSMFRLSSADGLGMLPPMVASWPQLGSLVGGGRRVVHPGPFYRVGGGQRRAFDDGQVPGTPVLWPPQAEPTPYLVIVTAMLIAPDRLTFSVYGAMGPADSPTILPGVCFTTPADGSVPHDTVPGNPLPPPELAPAPGGDTDVVETGGGTTTALTQSPEVANGLLDGVVAQVLGAAGQYPALTRLILGGAVPVAGGGGGTQEVPAYDTLHQAAVWNRALTPAEVAWLGTSLDKLFLSIDTPESQCGGGTPCTEQGGPGTANPLLTGDGRGALSPTRIARLDRAAIARNEGDGLRETRPVFTQGGRVYELVWELDNGQDLERVREAMRVTRNGASSTKWRHPTDDVDAAQSTICAAPRWRIVASEGVTATRNAAGHVGRFSIRLEEQVR